MHQCMLILSYPHLKVVAADQIKKQFVHVVYVYKDYASEIIDKAHVIMYMLTYL